VSDQYVADRLLQASKDGYVEVAFGLRVRTPLLSQVVWGSSRVPFEAQAEGRTAGNAMGIVTPDRGVRSRCLRPTQGIRWPQFRIHTCAGASWFPSEVSRVLQIPSSRG
jgi:hypothetical protein